MSTLFLPQRVLNLCECSETQTRSSSKQGYRKRKSADFGPLNLLHKPAPKSPRCSGFSIEFSMLMSWSHTHTFTPNPSPILYQSFPNPYKNVSESKNWLFHEHVWKFSNIEVFPDILATFYCSALVLASTQIPNGSSHEAYVCLSHLPRRTISYLPPIPSREISNLNNTITMTGAMTINNGYKGNNRIKEHIQTTSCISSTSILILTIR